MRKLVAAVCLLLTISAAHAQTGSVKTQAALNTEIGTTGCALPTCLYPDSPAGSITAFGLRQGLLDLTATMFSGGGVPVNGPTTTTAGDFAAWDNATGTLLKDVAPGTGVSAAFILPINAAGGLLTYAIIGTSGATVPLNNGGFTQSGTVNFTGTFELGGTTVTLPVSVSNGGTGAATLATGKPLFGAGTSAITTGTLSGNTTEIATVSGSLVNGHCAQWDSSGNAVDSGGACGGGGGSGTVTSATAGQFAYYASTGTTVAGGTFGTGLTLAGSTLNGTTVGGLTGAVLLGTGFSTSGNTINTPWTVSAGHVSCNLGTCAVTLGASTAPNSVLDLYSDSSNNGFLSIGGKGQYVTPQTYDTACGVIGHDCTTALNSCATNAAGLPCVLPPNTVTAISATQVLNAGGQTIRGSGPTSTIEMLSSGAGTPAIEVENTGITLSDFSIVYQSQGTGAGGAAPSTGGFAIYENGTLSSGNQALFTAERIFIKNAYIGIMSTNSNENVYRDIFIYNSTYAGVFCNACGMYEMDNVNAAGGMTQAALYIYGNAGGKFDGGEWEAATGYGLDIQPDGSGLALNFSRLTGMFFDNPLLGNLINGAYNNIFNGDYFSTSVGSGPVNHPCLDVIGSAIHLSFEADFFPNCGADGLFVESGNFVTVSNNQVTNNGLFYAPTPTSAGIKIGSGVSNFEVLGNISTGTYQVYGVYVIAGAQFGSVQNNLINSNANAGVFNAGTNVSVQATNY